MRELRRLAAQRGMAWYSRAGRCQLAKGRSGNLLWSSGRSNRKSILERPETQSPDGATNVVWAYLTQRENIMHTVRREDREKLQEPTMPSVTETTVTEAPAPEPEGLASASPPAIFAALAAIMRETTAIAKDRTNTQQGFKYRGIDDVYNSIHPSFARHGVFTTSKILERLREDRVTRTGGTLVLTQLRLEYTFHCCADGSHVATEVWGEGMDSADKSSNKALAAGHKYALLQMLLIPTDEAKDPDGDSPPPTSPPPRAAQSATKAASGPMNEGKAAPPQTPPEPPLPPKPITAAQHKRLEARINELGLDRESVREWLLIHLGGEDLHLNQIPQSSYAELDSKMEDWAALEHVLKEHGIDRGKALIWAKHNGKKQGLEIDHLADVPVDLMDPMVTRATGAWKGDSRWTAPQSAPAPAEEANHV